jgi:hypothetical protein
MPSVIVMHNVTTCIYFVHATNSETNGTSRVGIISDVLKLYATGMLVHVMRRYAQRLEQ